MSRPSKQPAKEKRRIQNSPTVGEHLSRTATKVVARCQHWINNVSSDCPLYKMENQIQSVHTYLQNKAIVLFALTLNIFCMVVFSGEESVRVQTCRSPRWSKGVCKCESKVAQEVEFICSQFCFSSCFVLQILKMSGA